MFLSILSEVNHRLESRMREIRQSGLEGGGRKAPYPYPGRARTADRVATLEDPHPDSTVFDPEARLD